MSENKFDPLAAHRQEEVKKQDRGDPIFAFLVIKDQVGLQINPIQGIPSPNALELARSLGECWTDALIIATRESIQKPKEPPK